MRPYYDVIRELGRGNADSGRQILLSNPDEYPLTFRPVNKREIYIKRCIATYFHVVTSGRPLDEADIKARYGLDITKGDEVRSLIRTYEGNKLDRRDGKIYINDREETNYTFKMNYYWMIGDNLHSSQDSRYWGFVPEDHLIGKVSSIL